MKSVPEWIALDPENRALNFVVQLPLGAKRVALATPGVFASLITAQVIPDEFWARERLAGVKSKWDPENTFRTNRNIKPL